MSDLPIGFLRAESQWLEEPEEIDEEARYQEWFGQKEEEGE